MGHNDQGVERDEALEPRAEDRVSMRGGRGSQPGNWRGYVMPYRYYGPGYQGVGYYSVMYQGPGDDEVEEAELEQPGRSGQAQGGGWREPGQAAWESGWRSRARQWSGQGTGRGSWSDERAWTAGSGRGPTSGRFRGQGPRGYQRSDERIREEISDRLMEHGELDASEIEVAVDKGEVTLSGTVPDRWTKRMAEDVAEQCMGVRDVMNQLRVHPSETSGSRTATRPRSSTATQGGQGGRTGQAGTNRSRSSTTSNGTRASEPATRR